GVAQRPLRGRELAIQGSLSRAARPSALGAAIVDGRWHRAARTGLRRAARLRASRQAVRNRQRDPGGMMDLLWVGLLLLGVLFLLLGLGVWVAPALIAVGVIAMEFFAGAPAGSILATNAWTSGASWTMTALPLFIWMGEILFRTKLSDDMFAGLSPWVSRLPGRLLHVNVLGCGIFAAVSGSSAATAATIGRISLPELKARGYPESLSLGSLAGSG